MRPPGGQLELRRENLRASAFGGASKAGSQYRGEPVVRVARLVCRRSALANPTLRWQASGQAFCSARRRPSSLSQV